jgi:hypothetical protein
LINETLRDIKGPLSLVVHWNNFLLLLFLVVLAGLLWLFWFLSKRKQRPLPVPKRLAHEIAYEQLRQLQAKGLIRQARIKEYYSEISDIVRRYLENRFSLRAPEMTTEEFLFYARDYGKLIAGHKTLLREFLSACDLVKFAKYLPQAQEIDAIFVSAKKLVDETKEEVPVK